MRDAAPAVTGDQAAGLRRLFALGPRLLPVLIGARDEAATVALALLVRADGFSKITAMLLPRSLRGRAPEARSALRFAESARRSRISSPE